MRARKKEIYYIRIKRVEAGLLNFGISITSARRLIYNYPIGVLEKLITATEKRHPDETGAYFLNGLKKSRMKHRSQPDLIEDEGGDEDAW
ncbi:MAG: hypothetical protein J7K94_02865 [Dehalococcoidia bacterium]|nr:hypothetical protein [Dehalococcoidia bacterium]